MKLEDQVCSLELAKKLKELGVKQESLWWWIGQYNLCPHKGYVLREKGFIDRRFMKEFYSVFTVAELGEMLPTLIISFKRNAVEYACMDYLTLKLRTDKIFSAKTEADARAKMLIYLIESKLVEVKG